MNETNCKSSKIVVVGAGLAGLTTAYRLKEQGFDNIEVYEARNRLGGRVFTVKLGDDIVELGGQNIKDGGKAENIRTLIRELNLELVSEKLQFQLYHFNGKEFIEPYEFLKDFNFTPSKLLEMLQSISLTSKNMDDVLMGLFKDNEILYQAFCTRLAAYEGCEPRYLSLNNLPTLYYMLLGGISAAHQVKGEENAYVERITVKGGNSVLIEKIAEKLPDQIHADSYLSSIKKDITNDSYILEFKTGNQIQKVSADIVVLAIPCTVYEDVQIEENVIPKEKLSAIQAVRYGTNSKIIVPLNFASPTNGAFSNNRMISFFTDQSHRTITMYYVGEHSKFTKFSIADTMNDDLPLLNKAYNFSLSKPPEFALDESFSSYSGPVGCSWPNDPYAKGSYSCMAVGQEELLTSLEHHHDETVKSLFAPINNSLFFAGEHASILFDVGGTMEAAVESGERTARLIKKVINSNCTLSKANLG